MYSCAQFVGFTFIYWAWWVVYMSPYTEPLHHMSAAHLKPQQSGLDLSSFEKCWSKQCIRRLLSPEQSWSITISTILKSNFDILDLYFSTSSLHINFGSILEKYPS